MDIQISNVFETRRGIDCFNIENYNNSENFKYREFRVLKSGELYCLDVPIKNVYQELQ